MDKINIEEKLSLFNDYWNPKIIGEINESYVKLAKLKGDFVWHTHENEDEMFYVLKGTLTMKFREKSVQLNEGECLVIPSGIEHMPVAEEEVHVMLIESKTTLNTGNVTSERTVKNLKQI
ncbi:cupin domain-containing protein [Acetobacterium woodii]|uniref:Cupin 2 conserved barrel domain protein n=1 Tax=Acetobacterium woodii (strain ATCC 29683 / DSM 1030 / JCM 2381 / KCTC 1655 / WB1) TaxID=931626 RepID=H6LKV9_ACEWD|nr:cupin domain-containing protein [Acetobacterium woodii]AFA50068.1 cupin 2 conserved barrel domain protein [Acetobacterium woodii DSM 1030]